MLLPGGERWGRGREGIRWVAADESGSVIHLELMILWRGECYQGPLKGDSLSLIRFWPGDE
jgi:hypothetical protein